MTRNFPPLVGGMERLALNVYRQLAQRHEVLLVGPSGSEAHVPPNAKARTSRLQPLALFLVSAQWAAYRLAAREKPDLVIACSGLVAPAALAAARRAGAPAIAFVHGLDLIAHSWIYQSIFVPLLRKFERVVTNSRNTAALARGRGIAERRIAVLHPGVDSPVTDDRDAQEQFKAALEVQGRPLLLSVGRLTPRKGLVEFLRLAMPAIVAEFPEASLVIIGGEPRSAVSSSAGELSRIKRAIDECGLAHNVQLLGTVEDKILVGAYQACDLFILPAREMPGDVEGFGMVALEAAAHGLPTAAFASGGIPDAVADGVSGWLVPTGAYTALADTVVRHLKAPDARPWRRQCREFASEFAWPRFGERLEAVVEASLVDG